MIKILFFFIFFILSYSEDIKVFGYNANIANNKIIIHDGMMIKNGMLISAKNIIYNKLTHTVIAKGNVYINYDKNDFILSNKVLINLDTKKIVAKPFFLFNFYDNSWILSKQAIKKDNVYYSKKTISSTCNSQNPDWKIVSTSVQYDKQKKWLNLYNPTLYLKNIPILYLPYLGFSLDKTRSSGFLRPLFGFSANEGILLTTPYYQTLGETADLELDPTIRTKRGKGIYSTFRFVHSATSKGILKAGIFNDFDKYNKKHNLAHKKHYGIEFKYTNYNLYLPNDKLYIDLKNANDIDYFYLDAYNYMFNQSYLSSKLLTSKLNYYTYKNNNYLGVYFKYFKDTSKLSNEDTMQILPNINYHIFNHSLYGNLLYSLDSNFYNYTRNKGDKLTKESLTLPINYNISFFDDYLKTSITEQLKISKVTTSDGNITNYMSLDTFLKLYSNLSKTYPTYTHHIAPSITFSMNNYSKYSGDESDYISKTNITKSIVFKLSQYFMADNWNLYHEISDIYYVDNKNTKSNFSDIFNDLSFTYKNYSLSDNNRYSIENNKIVYYNIKASYQNDIFNLNLFHSYQAKTTSNNKSESYTINSGYKFDKFHKIFGSYNYDMVLNMVKYYTIGISMSKRCWNYSFSLKRETIPILTENGISSNIQKTFYFEIELIPLGGVKQQYQFKTQKAE